MPRRGSRITNPNPNPSPSPNPNPSPNQARLAHRLHPTDLTDASLAVRQSDQEALWLELFTGPPAQQPALLVLPEEYYCPAVAGTKQAIDIAARLSLGLRPAWGYAGKKS